MEEKTMEKVFEITSKNARAPLEAITDTEMKTQIHLRTVVTSDWTTGSRYEVSAGSAHFRGRNLEVDPPRRLVQSFRALWRGRKERGDLAGNLEIEQSAIHAL